MKFIADFHIHSKFSRATSKQMEVENLDKYARIKGIDLLGTGDFTHPLWLSELREKLRPTKGGLYTYRKTHFVLTAEVCNIFKDKGRGRRIHNIVFVKSLEIAEKLNRELSKFGSLWADGRPMLKLEARHLMEIVLEIDESSFVVPAHIWTPYFSLFGAKSGFDIIEECFGDQTSNIFALETGLSSDPKMNWRLSCLDRFSLISNSDAHSLPKLGREANVFDCDLSYDEIRTALESKDKKKFLSTIEFFPEEGKYHYDGHRACNSRLSPEETRKNNRLCPVCGKPVTVGVMNRVKELSDREEGFVPESAIPYKNLIPLEEIIAQAINKRVGTKAVGRHYQNLIHHFKSEFFILLEAAKEELCSVVETKIASAIIMAREGKVDIKPGYDGLYGEIDILKEEEWPVQISLFTANA
ncbi:endonuclease Q family protein [bacterium]|nr:endonuclease Q family protein [bacterium]MBU1614895.1 endonuclease Q family protein [bacterium]